METETVELKPNYGALRKRFEQNAEYSARGIANCLKRGVAPTAGDVRNLVVYLNIALQSVHNGAALDEYRKTFAGISSGIADADDKFQEREL